MQHWNTAGCRIRFDPFANFKATNVRQPNVEDDQIRNRGRFIQRIGAAVRFNHLEARFGQLTSDGVAIGFVVVDMQNDRRFSHWRALARLARHVRLESSLGHGW